MQLHLLTVISILQAMAIYKTLDGTKGQQTQSITVDDKDPEPELNNHVNEITAGDLQEIKYEFVDDELQGERDK